MSEVFTPNLGQNIDLFQTLMDPIDTVLPPVQDVRPNRIRSFTSLAMASLALIGTTPALGAETNSTTQSTIKVCGPSTPLNKLPVLTKGDTGPCVNYARRLLLKHGRFIPVTNPATFGVITKGETTGFQVQTGISNTGNVGPLTWRALRKATSNHGLAPICKTMKNGACVNKHNRTVTLMRNGRPEFTYPIRTGDKRGPEFRTDEGIFRVQSKNRNAISTQYGNTPMPYAVFYNGGEAFHYSRGFELEGYNGASHGCVNLKINPSKAVFRYLQVGNPVAVY